MDSAKTEKDKNVDGFLKEIMAISGHPGLFRFISQARNGIIVESLDTGKRMQAFSSMKISALEEIAVFTDDEEVSLAEVLKLISEKEDGGPSIDHKSESETLKAYFADVLPAYDRDRVYVSDIKKIINWYNILHRHELLKFDEEEAEASENAGTAGDDETAGEADQAASDKKKAKKSGKDTPAEGSGGD